MGDNAAMSRSQPRAATQPEPAWAAGVVARRLGIPPSTLRAWNRRYGIGPADHQAGRHRHYTEHDISVLETMRQLMGQGVLPAAAAAIATARRTPGEAAELTCAPATAPHPRAVPELVTAAMRFDVESALQNLETNLDTHGVVATWNQLCRPALTAIGRRIDETSSCIDVELLLAWAITTSLHGLIRRSPTAGRTRLALLACAECEQHDLPLEALHAALTQHGVATRMLGPSVPADALEDAIRRTTPAAVVLFAQVPRTARLTVLHRIRASTDSTIAAGSGWRQTSLPAEVSLATSLEHALELVQAAVRSPALTSA